jgi:hypothetical protein
LPVAEEGIDRAIHTIMLWMLLRVPVVLTVLAVVPVMVVLTDKEELLVNIVVVVQDFLEMA